MIDFTISNVDLIVKELIHDLSPVQVSDQIPGLTAHFLFMCVRYCDYTNDDEKLQILLTSAISAIGIVTKVTSLSLSFSPFGVCICIQVVIHQCEIIIVYFIVSGIKGWVSVIYHCVNYCFDTGSLQQIAIKIFSLVYLHFGKLQSNTFTERISR